MSDLGNKGGSQPKYSPNDDKSIGKNPNNPAYDAAKANEAKQGGGSPKKG
jgi:hypothetical protein